MRKILINPFLMFGLTFLYVFISFNMGLSDLYLKTNDYSLNLIFACFIIMCLFLGGVYHLILLSRNKYLFHTSKFISKRTFSNSILIVGFIVECANNGGVPLILVLKGAVYDYTQFGIKTFHVFYMGYLSASAIINFERYLFTRSKYYLISPLLAIIITILILNRGALLLILFPIALMYIASLRVKIKIKHFVFISAMLIAVIVGFGILGDKRLLSSGYEESDAILKIGEASPVFENVPTGFFWVYLYSTSPFANLMLQANQGNFNQGDIGDFLATSIYPDFISKYTNPNMDDRFSLLKITPELNVGTAFCMPLITFGIAGLIMYFAWFLIFNILFIWLNKNNYLLSTAATLTSIAIFLSFNNMLTFSSCVLQIIFITVLSRLRCGRKMVM